MPVCSFGGPKCPKGPGASGPIEVVREHEARYHGKRFFNQGGTAQPFRILPSRTTPADDFLATQARRRAERWRKKRVK